MSQHKSIVSIYCTTLPPCYRQRSGINHLLTWAYQFSPIIALDRNPNHDKHDPRFCGLNLDMSGSALLFKDTSYLLTQLHTELRSFGIEARLCFAPTLGAAWALSRYHPQSQSIVSHQSIKQMLSPLPLKALRLSDKNIAALHELNITTIEHLLGIPTESLKLRFSQEVVLRLHYALGSLYEPLNAVSFTPRPTAQRSFTGAGGGSLESQEALLFHTKELLRALLKPYQRSSQAISQISIQFRFCKAPPLTQFCSSTLATNDFSQLWKLLRYLVEQCPVELGVEEVVLSCIHAQHTKALSSSFIPGHSASQEHRGRLHSKESLALLDSLRQRLGAKRVCTLLPRESHIPERSFVYQAANESTTRATTAQLVRSMRPSLLFTTPVAIQAIAALPDSPPARIRWRGTMHTIRSGIGPERITPEWWNKELPFDVTRDYFRLQLQDGLWLWVYRTTVYRTTVEHTSAAQHWFLHGIWS